MEVCEDSGELISNGGVAGGPEASETLLLSTASPPSFTLDTDLYCAYYKKNGATDKPVTRVTCIFSSSGRYRNQTRPPVPFNRRFVTAKGPLIDVEFDRVLRHPDDSPVIRRFIVDVSNIHFMGAFGANNNVGIPNMLDGQTGATRSSPAAAIPLRGFVNFGSPAVSTPSQPKAHTPAPASQPAHIPMPTFQPASHLPRNPPPPSETVLASGSHQSPFDNTPSRSSAHASFSQSPISPSPAAVNGYHDGPPPLMMPMAQEAQTAQYYHAATVAGSSTVLGRGPPHYHSAAFLSSEALFTPILNPRIPTPGPSNSSHIVPTLSGISGVVGDIAATAHPHAPSPLQISQLPPSTPPLDSIPPAAPHTSLGTVSPVPPAPIDLSIYQSAPDYANGGSSNSMPQHSSHPENGANGSQFAMAEPAYDSPFDETHPDATQIGRVSSVPNLRITTGGSRSAPKRNHASASNNANKRIRA
ncbi:hypothetical protein DFP72DRAFT_858174 [Ephemerocybe angulata]|uniref:Uncharacterized protein n=1 Tax=Ephemerocybe angulata TaxID=980116 RepID=A0A8H6HDL6_9AGAR|nr:hypothetical protein DFP72DRAFT_858174 [Tulosesus angulatus]